MRLLFLLLICCNVNAAIFVNQDARGNLIYSDTPSKNARVVEVGAKNIISIPNPSHTASTPVASSSPAKALPGQASYASIEIIAPKNAENIHNQPTLNIAVKTDPALAKTDQIIVLVDGQQLSVKSSTSIISIPTPERGQHSLVAAVVDANNRILLRSAPITVFIHQTTTNFRPGNR